MPTGADRQRMDAHGGLGLGGGVDGTIPGKFFNFRFKFIAFKAYLMGFISRSLSLGLLPGHPGQGLKIAIVPEQSVDLAGLGFIQVSDDASVYMNYAKICSYTSQIS